MQVINALKTSTHKSVCFGDAENDISMFKLIDTSIAMCNANTITKGYAKYITDGFNDDGVAKALVKIFNLKI